MTLIDVITDHVSSLRRNLQFYQGRFSQGFFCGSTRDSDQNRKSAAFITNNNVIHICTGLTTLLKIFSSFFCV